MSLPSVVVVVVISLTTYFMFTHFLQLLNLLLLQCFPLLDSTSPESETSEVRSIHEQEGDMVSFHLTREALHFTPILYFS